MNKLKKLGLAGIILTGGFALNQKSLAQEAQPLIRENKAYESKNKKNISYERTILFNTPYITGQNTNPQKDELDFFICPEDELKIKTKVFDSYKEVTGNEYILTKIRDPEGLEIQKWKDIPLESMIRLKKKTNYKNKIASIQDFTKEIEFIYTPVEINGQSFILINPAQTLNNRKFIDFTNNAKQIVLIPYNQNLELTIDNKTGKIDISSIDGCFQPRLRESVYNTNEDTNEKISELKKETNYMKYKKEMENKKENNLEKFSAESNTKNVSNISQDKQKKEENSLPEPSKIYQTREYIVKQGEGYWSIAREQLKDEKRFKEIQELNKGLKSEDLKPGQKIFIPLK